MAPPSRLTQPDGQVRSYEVIAAARHHLLPLDAAALRTFLEPPRPTRPPAGLPAIGSRPDKLAAWVASRPEGARNHGLSGGLAMIRDGVDDFRCPICKGGGSIPNTTEECLRCAGFG